MGKRVLNPLEVSRRFKDLDGMPLGTGFYVARDGEVYRVNFSERDEYVAVDKNGGRAHIRDADAFAGGLRRINNPMHNAQFMLRDSDKV